MPKNSHIRNAAGKRFHTLPSDPVKRARTDRRNWIKIAGKIKIGPIYRTTTVEEIKGRIMIALARHDPFAAEMHVEEGLAWMLDD